LPRLRAIVADLTTRAGLPMPRLYIIERPEPNAFATGRDPEHSAVAVTRGILEIMDDRHLAGVLAHELSHVKNRDTLVGTIAATIGGAISFLAQMAQFQMIFGGRDDNRGGGGIGALVAIILAPIAALIIQLAVSRGREYGADASGAALTGDPEALAQALERLEAATSQNGLRARLSRSLPGSRGRVPAPAPAANPAFAHLYIVNPLSLRASEACSRPTRRSRTAFSGCTRWPAEDSVGQPDSLRISQPAACAPRADWGCAGRGRREGG
jgi:heat shock protein HtpX